MRLTRKPGEAPLQPLLAAHFASVPLDALEITRRDFPHWMRPDLQRGLEGLFAAVADARFFGARLRDRELDFRFADLAEGGRLESKELGPVGFEPTTKGFRFARVSPLPGLSHHLRPDTGQVSGALGGH